MHDAPIILLCISPLNEMLIKKRNLSKILPQATINVFSILYIVTKTAVDSTHTLGLCVPLHAIKLEDFNLAKDRRTDRSISTEI